MKNIETIKQDKEGFFSKIMDKLDKKLEEKAKKECSCNNDAKKGNSCCSK